MDFEKDSASVFCPDHESQPIITYCARVNPDPHASKHIYCVKCLMQPEDSKELDSTFPKISDFLASAATAFAEYKGQIKYTGQGPKEYLARHNESLDNFSAHISHEKIKIETFFTDITNTIVDTIQQLKEQYLQTLNTQIARLEEGYSVFENMLKRFYPAEEDSVTMFPTKEDLEERLANISTTLELEDFVKRVKQALESNKEEALYSNRSDDAKQKYLADYDKFFKDIDNAKPTFEEKANIQSIKDALRKQITQLVATGNVFTLHNEVSLNIMRPDLLPYPKSAIINSKQFQTLKEWLPENTDLNLLYRMSRDGKDRQAFYSQCDNQGPTVTLIKCKYEGASQSSIIGGFVDQSFDHKVDGWIKSNQAFVFSLTPPTKCTIRTGPGSSAFYNHPNRTIWFGNGGTIGIDDFSSSYSQIYEDSFYRSYNEDHKIIPPESYKGPKIQIPFKIEELEVYTLN